MKGDLYLSRMNVSRDILVDKLKFYCLDNKNLDVIKYYLCFRCQLVNLNDNNISNNKLINCGVP